MADSLDLRLGAVVTVVTTFVLEGAKHPLFFLSHFSFLT